jgi:JmjC domain, hydroxylase/C5HC2 zinc finger
VNSPLRFETKHQVLRRLQEGVGFDDGQRHTIYSYQDAASRHSKEWKNRFYSRQSNSSSGSSNLKEVTRHQDGNPASISERSTSIGEFIKLKGNQPARSQASQTEAKEFNVENLERDYWSVVEARFSNDVAVDYGNDVDTEKYGSGFAPSQRGRSVNEAENDTAEKHSPDPEFGSPEFYRETWWNLRNTAKSPGSVLRYVKTGINGINVPWMYYGSLFTTFCWHNEDNYLYSINYNHRGAPKIWYGVPGSKEGADGLERVFKGYLSMKLRDVPDLMHHITTMFSPRLLQNANVPVYRWVQYEREFVITFPRGFHGGFSLGPNVGEAVNFATHDWISHGADANERYRSFARPAVFSHDRLTFTMANHLEDQRTSATCSRLLAELERVVAEELRLREQLLDSGVRDVSDLIELRKNRLDQLDPESSDYDDKRLCHACKHVCFFSAVACECSKSKVSCLRHSHFMCRCVPQRRYFLLWSDDEELNSTLTRVREHCEALSRQEESNDGGDEFHSENPNAPLAECAPGVDQDRLLHLNDEISTEPFWNATRCASRRNSSDVYVEGRQQELVVPPKAEVSVSASSSVTPPITLGLSETEESDDEVQVIKVVGPNI